MPSLRTPRLVQTWPTIYRSHEATLSSGRSVATVRRNIISNLASGAWIAILTLAITPLQVNILGVEAYGLLGFIATLQMMLSVFDLGLSSTITREIAADHSPGRQRSRPLLRTTATIYWALAIIIGVSLGVAAGGIARFWFNPKAVDVALLEQGLRVIALYLALRWPVAFYTGVLTGLQRMDVLNAVKVATASLRLVGGIVVLLVWRDLSAFLWWISLNAVIEVIAYARSCRIAFPGMDWRPGIFPHAVREVWGYSIRMSAISVLTLLITQLDRLVVSKLLPLESFGYYSLAYNTAAGVSVVLSAVNSAMLPSFASAQGAGSRELLIRRYDNANRVLLFCVGFPVLALVFFGEPILRIWVNPVAAMGAWQPMAFLAAGFWLSAATSNAYNVALACRRPGLPLKISLISAVPYALGLYWMTGAYGANGAAAAWMTLNLFYVLVLVPAVHRLLLDIPFAPWFLRTLIPFWLLGFAAFGIPRYALEHWFNVGGGAASVVALTFALLCFGGVGAALLGAGIRADLLGLVRRFAGIQG
jgi:O-antigen/teichoic acid export membrane protein